MRKFFALMMLVIMATSSIGAQPTANTTAPAPATAPKAAPELTAADLETFLDGVIPSRLRTEDIAGLTIAVVKDGQLLFAKGYGYSDVANKKPVDPQTTMFRPGSVSKLFTWTAVMQLVEQGKLDLNKDVNEYLDFKIPDAYGQPITLTNILTHTAGFEEAIKDLMTTEEVSPDLGKFVKTHIPTRIFPPGKVPAYSNYATSLAGYIVERVSGVPFSQYIEANIFKPLGMNSSTFVQPLPDNLKGNMSKGYALASDPEKPFEVVVSFPAGSLSSPAADMAKFMIAHLQNGQYGDARILKEETAKLMHSRLWGMDPAINGMAHGFYEENQNGLRIVGHGGDTQSFHSDLHLLLDKNIGVFMSYNSGGRNQASTRDIIFKSFLNRYFPFEVVEKPTPDGAKEESKLVAGSYLSSRRADASLFKAVFLLGDTDVTAKENGNIEISMLKDLNGKPIQWRPIGNMMFQEVGGESTVSFRPNDQGALQIVTRYPFMTFTKVGALYTTKTLTIILGFSLGLMILTLVLWPVAWFVRRNYGRRLEQSADQARLRLGVRIVFALNLFFVLSLLYVITTATSNLGGLNDALVTKLWIVQAVGIVATIGHLLVFFNAFKAWTSANAGLWAKIQATLFALASIGAIWIVYVSNMLVFKSTF